LLGFYRLTGRLGFAHQVFGFPAGIGIVSGALPPIVGGYWAWVPLGAVVGFAFAMMALSFILQVRKRATIFQQISIDGVGIMDVGVVGLDGSEKLHKLTNLTLKCTLRNHSEQTVFYSLRRVTHSVQGRTPTRSMEEQVNIVHAKSIQLFSLATLPDIELGHDLPKGHIDLEIAYGPSKDNLRYLFRYESTPLIGWTYYAERKSGQLNIISPIKRIAHERRATGFLVNGKSRNAC